MIDLLLTYCLCVYLLFHVWNRSDLTHKARNWMARHAPGWFTYATSCALCATWWISLTLWVFGIMGLGIITVLAAPVINLVLDLVVRTLIRANEPPLICVSSQPSTSTTTGTVVRVGTSDVYTSGTAGSDICTGGLVTVAYFGLQTRATCRWGMGAEWPWPDDVGRRVKVTKEHAYGPAGEGHITGRSGTISRVGAVTCAWAYWITPDGGGQAFSAVPGDCTFLDGPDAPFNPLDHEQTK